MVARLYLRAGRDSAPKFRSLSVIRLEVEEMFVVRSRQSERRPRNGGTWQMQSLIRSMEHVTTRTPTLSTKIPAVILHNLCRTHLRLSGSLPQTPQSSPLQKQIPEWSSATFTRPVARVILRSSSSRTTALLSFTNWSIGTSTQVVSLSRCHAKYPSQVPNPASWHAQGAQRSRQEEAGPGQFTPGCEK